MATLLRGGKVLVHDAEDHVNVVEADVVIVDGIIEKIESDIFVDTHYTVIDCTGKIISPGFVDTHHHMWQTQMKGLHCDHSLLEYIPQQLVYASFYKPDDVFYGQLAGELEALNGGITTVLDHSHINYSPEHVFAAIQASEMSGMRSIYGYSPTLRAQLGPKEMGLLPFLDPWIMETFGKLAEDGPWTRTTLGFAFDGLFLPRQLLKPILDQVYSAPGVNVLTTHDNSTSTFHNKPSAFQVLSELDLFDPANKSHWVAAHSSKLHKCSAADVKKRNFFTSITPVTELSMGMGQPVPIALNPEHAELKSQVSVGIDCHAIGESFMPAQLRAQLLAVRQHVHARADAQDKWYASMAPSRGDFPAVEDAFNLATIGGARALGMADSIGRIQPGYKADLIFFDSTSPSMLAVAEENPVGAIVLHSQPSDVAGVMIDGHMRKWDGKLLPTRIMKASGLLGAYEVPFEGELTWAALAQAVLRSRARIMSLTKQMNLPVAIDGVLKSFQLNTDGIMDQAGKLAPEEGFNGHSKLLSEDSVEGPREYAPENGMNGPSQYASGRGFNGMSVGEYVQ